jgi:predicted HicB family RNase H-like nuclease
LRKSGNGQGKDVPYNFEKHYNCTKIGIKNQVNKLTNNPTMRWIFQLFQGIHYVLTEGKEYISNLKEERKEILSYFSINCQKYY